MKHTEQSKDCNYRVFWGDNLEILRDEISDESVDLIYLDPPFKSDRNYDASERRKNGAPSNGKVRAFRDTWQWNANAEADYRLTVQAGGECANALQSFRTLLGETDMLAYLSMITPRLVEFHRVLKSTGTIYLHCDPSASHCLKLLMDVVFGIANMRNEIVWCYRGGGVPKNDFARKHDIILRYSKSDDYYFDVDAVRIPYSDDVMNSLPSRYDKSYRANKVYEGYRPNPRGKHPEDWWPIQAILPSSGERLGYPTQKPLELLERIIKASSKEDDLVLDPFCGSGTTLVASKNNNRRTIGIDVSELAVDCTNRRLAEMNTLF